MRWELTKRHAVNLITNVMPMCTYPMHAFAYLRPQDSEYQWLLLGFLYLVKFFSVVGVIMTIRDRGEVILEGSRLVKLLPTMMKAMYVAFTIFIII